ncbi:hypothetical protein OUZ56_005743 [Daphnia magna]|uniref:Uncharacterized protein n=1 Tax=Daphnia magna TaxID=35525 RepID=A0ABQ9YTQ0_9CRUS|nr:hypothetical protein OUZ56_005743 [Daphnia magna]
MDWIAFEKGYPFMPVSDAELSSFKWLGDVGPLVPIGGKVVKKEIFYTRCPILVQFSNQLTRVLAESW